MKKTVVIHQPDFLPYIGFFQRLLDADLLVLLDDVQFQARGKMAWQNRDKIKTQSGEKWLTIPVKKCGVKTKINDVKISDSVDWVSNNLNQLEGNYRNALHFNEIFPLVKELHNNPPLKLLSFNMKGLQLILEILDIPIEIIFSSHLNVMGHGNDRLVNILKKVKATHYLSGEGARDYYDPEPYLQAGIEVIWHKFEHPVYPQQFGEFIPYLCILDLLFNCGVKKSREILKNSL